MNVLMILFLILPATAQVDNGWELLTSNKHEEARAPFQAAFDGEDADIAMIGWFLTHVGRGSGPELEEAALNVLRRAPDSGAAEFVLKWMMPMVECLPGFTEGTGAIYEDLTPNNPEVRYMIASVERARARNRVEKPDFAAITNRAGVVTDYLISPIYGAYPSADWARSWPPEQIDGWTDAQYQEMLSGILIPPRESSGPGVYYALTRFNNPVEQAVDLRLFSYQNATVYLNGKHWITRRNLEEIGPNKFYSSATLPAGEYEVVIKTSQLRNKDGQLSLQITAPQAPEFLKPEGPARFALEDGEPMAAVAVRGLRAQLEGNRGELPLFAQALVLLRDRDLEPALDIFNDLSQMHPASLLVAGRTAEIYLGGVPFLPQQDQISRAYQMLGALARDPSPYNLENRLNLGLLLGRVQQTKPALELITSVVDANPAFCNGLTALLGAADSQNLPDVRTRVLNAIDDLGPNNQWGRTRLLAEAKKDGDLEQTRTMLENLAQLLPWDGYVAQLEEMNENYDAAVKDYERRWELFPNRDYYPYSIAVNAVRLGDVAAQREWLERTLAINPGHREAILDMVNLDSYEGKLDDARRRLTEYLAVEPGDAFFRQRLSHLEGRTAFDQYRVPAEKVIEEAKNKPMSEGADSELLLDQLMVRLFPDGSQMRYTHLVTRVLTKKGVDEEGELPIRGNLEILNLRTIKQDGSVFYPESWEEKSTISLAGIGVGDFIDEEHIEYLPPASYDADGLDAEMTFIFQGQDRIYHHSELVLIYPADLEVKPVLLDRFMPTEKTIEEKDGLIYVRWLTKDLPPLPNEPEMTSTAFFTPTATFYYNSTWEEIRDFYYSAMALRMGLSQNLKNLAAGWRKDYSDDRELAETVYRLVVDRTEPGQSIYTNVNLVWETSRGNATLLLQALFREMGLDSDIVFVQTRTGEEALFDIPMPSHAYTLIRLNVGEETIWLDPNQQNLPFGYVPHPFRDVRGLIADPTELFTQVPAFSDESERVSTEYKLYFNDEGGLNGFGTEKFYGMFAAQVKETYAALNRPEIKQRVEVGVNTTYPGAAVNSVNIKEGLPIGEFELSHEFTHPNLAEAGDKKLKVSFPLPETPLLDRYGVLPNRETPMRVRAPHYNVSDLELLAPLGYTWQEEPRIVFLENEMGHYKLETKVEEGRKLILKRSYYLKAMKVTPEQYPEFLEFCKSMVENENISFIALKEGGSP